MSKHATALDIHGIVYQCKERDDQSSEQQKLTVVYTAAHTAIAQHACTHVTKPGCYSC
jgi:hypothetical protein